MYYVLSTAVQLHKEVRFLTWKFDNSKPIYIQIADKIEMMILSGEYKSGDSLPSVRDFAVQASVNPNTMQRAMQELEARGLIFVQRAVGRLVTEDKAVIEKCLNEKVKSITLNYLNEIKSLNIKKDDAVKILNENWEN